MATPDRGAPALGVPDVRGHPGAPTAHGVAGRRRARSERPDGRAEHVSRSDDRTVRRGRRTLHRESDRVDRRTSRAAAPLPVWVKRADVHNTQEGDVVFAATEDAVESALGGLAERGIARAVLQPHVDGDLIKFYGIGPGRTRRRASVVPLVLSQGPAPSPATHSIRAAWRGWCAGPRPPSVSRSTGATSSSRRPCRHRAARSERVAELRLYRDEAAVGDRALPDARASAEAADAAARARPAVAADRRAGAAPHGAGAPVLRAVRGCRHGAGRGLDALRRGWQRVHRFHRRHWGRQRRSLPPPLRRDAEAAGGAADLRQLHHGDARPVPRPALPR